MVDVAASIQNASGALSLEEQVARLHALLEATRQVHSTGAFHEVLAQTARILVRELELEGAVFLSPRTGEVLSSYGVTPPAPFPGCTQFSLLGRNAEPLAQLAVRTSGGVPLSLFEQDFIEGLVLQAAVALENATLHQRDLQWARVEQDLEAARGVQRSLLPRSMPDIPGLSIAAHTVTCYQVGGDYLDAFSMPDGSHLFVVADVAGKGLASAIVATSFRAAFRSLATQPLSLAEMVGRIGQGHWEEGEEARQRYVTAIFARFRVEEGTLEIVNAGHNPGLLVSAEGTVRLLEASGTPLGMLPGMRYEAETVGFQPGSRLLLYTDGLTEVFCGDEEFGCERLTAAFQHSSARDAEESLQTLWSQLRRFSTDAPQTDDMTALAILHLDRRGEVRRSEARGADVRHTEVRRTA